MQDVQVIFESKDIIAVAKHAPLATVPARSTPDSVLGRLQAEVAGEVFAVHRIDQRVSGVILFARSRPAAARLSKLFAGPDVVREYWAICESAPREETGRLEHVLVRDGRRRKARVVRAGGRACVLDYTVVGFTKSFALLTVSTQMGRFHQVRAQLAAAGAIVRGDLKYGARRSTKSGMIGLHARALHFPAGTSAETAGGRSPEVGLPTKLVAPVLPRRQNHHDVDADLWAMFPDLQDSRDSPEESGPPDRSGTPV